MSRRPFDFLASDKEPFNYIERGKVRLNDGMLHVIREGVAPEIISPAATLILLLGPGTSISQEAAIFCAVQDMQIAFVRGQCNVHSFFMSGRYQDPGSVLHQAQLVSAHKFEVAQHLMTLRLRLAGYGQSVVDGALREPDIAALTAWEGRWAQGVYRDFSLRHGKPFARDFDGNDLVNEKLNILNNALYSTCTAICLSCGLHPSLGFIHGQTRRGGLAFDLADLIKHKTTLPLAFDDKVASGKVALHRLAGLLRERNCKLSKLLIAVCLAIGTLTPEEIGVRLADYHSQ